MSIPVLIIDDNRKYTALLQQKLDKADCTIEHKLSSAEGISFLTSDDPNRFRIIITDITMETQVSGILLSRRIRRSGFMGCLVIYSTGFNFRIVLWLSKFLFRLLGADGLIAKNGFLDGEPKIIKISDNDDLSIIESALAK